jgi:Ni2+-binding GTPase involved in maturation of urease and hydrogenase
MYNSTTIVKAKAMSETLSKVSFDSLTNDTAKHNYENMLGILTRLSVVAGNYEKLCHTDASLIRAYEDRIGELEREIIRLKNDQANIKWTNINI